MTIPSKHKIKGVFFDLYGTLLNYNGHEKASRAWINSFVNFIGTPYNLNYAQIEILCGKILNDNIEETKPDYLTTYEFKIKHHLGNLEIKIADEHLKHIADTTVQCWQDHITLADEAIEVLSRLSKSKTVALISNFDHTPHVKKVLSEHKLDLYLNPIIISDEAGIQKPDPSIFRLALNQANLTHDEVIFVGDSYNDDIEGARSASIFPILIDHNSGEIPSKIIHDQDLIQINSLSALLDIL